jgi:predicted proteasome-type protease
MKASDYDNKKLEIEKAIKNLRESSKRRKGELLLEIKKLEDLKAYASDTMKQILQRYRNTQAVAEVYNKIKEIEDWAEQAIQVSKSKQINELPIVP